jgi:hypothetical protein
MEKSQRDLYLLALAKSVALVMGPRDEDYNKGGIGLRDYWKVNGILGPIQMVDMKVKRAQSIVAGQRTVPAHKAEKLLESMADALNYAAFVECEAVSQTVDSGEKTSENHFTAREMELADLLGRAIEAWKNR